MHSFDRPRRSRWDNERASVDVLHANKILLSDPRDVSQRRILNGVKETHIAAVNGYGQWLKHMSAKGAICTVHCDALSFQVLRKSLCNSGEYPDDPSSCKGAVTVQLHSIICPSDLARKRSRDATCIVIVAQMIGVVAGKAHAR